MGRRGLPSALIRVLSTGARAIAEFMTVALRGRVGTASENIATLLGSQRVLRLPRRIRLSSVICSRNILGRLQTMWPHPHHA